MTKYALLVAAVLLAPAVSSAATYFYVNVDGEVDSVEASSPAEALRIAPRIAANSGVAIDRGLLEEGMRVSRAAVNPSLASGNTGGSPALGTGGPNRYAYVTNEGETAFVSASNPQTAILVAPNRHPNSGVAIDDGTIESGEEVESVAD